MIKTTYHDKKLFIRYWARLRLIYPFDFKYDYSRAWANHRRLEAGKNAGRPGNGEE